MWNWAVWKRTELPWSVLTSLRQHLFFSLWTLSTRSIARIHHHSGINSDDCWFLYFAFLYSVLTFWFESMCLFMPIVVYVMFHYRNMYIYLCQFIQWATLLLRLEWAGGISQFHSCLVTQCRVRSVQLLTLCRVILTC